MVTPRIKLASTHLYTWLHCEKKTMSSARGPFLEDPERFSHPKSRSKILNFMITEQFYSHILIRLYMNRGSIHMQEVSSVYIFLFLDTDQFKMALRVRNVSGPQGSNPDGSIRRRTLWRPGWLGPYVLFHFKSWTILITKRPFFKYPGIYRYIETIFYPADCFRYSHHQFS